MSALYTLAYPFPHRETTALMHQFIVGLIEDRFAKSPELYPGHPLTLSSVKDNVMLAVQSRQCIMNMLQMAYDKCYCSGPVDWPE